MICSNHRTLSTFGIVISLEEMTLTVNSCNSAARFFATYRSSNASDIPDQWLEKERRFLLSYSRQTKTSPIQSFKRSFTVLKKGESSRASTLSTSALNCYTSGSGSIGGTFMLLHSIWKL